MIETGRNNRLPNPLVSHARPPALRPIFEQSGVGGDGRHDWDRAHCGQSPGAAKVKLAIPTSPAERQAKMLFFILDRPKTLLAHFV